MANKLKAICNKGCGKRFTVFFSETPVGGGIYQVGFSCTKCGMHYPAYYTNDKIKKLQEEQQDLLKRSDPRTRNYQSLGGIKSAITRKKQQIKREMDRLKDEVEYSRQ